MRPDLKRSSALLFLFLFPLLCSAQEGKKRYIYAPTRIVTLYFSICSKDTTGCDKHSAVLKRDSFLTEERLDKRLIATTSGSYDEAYSKYFRKVYEITEKDIEALSKAEKRKSNDENVYTIEIKEGGQTKKYEIVRPKRTDVPHRLVNQYRKIDALASAIKKAQNAYGKGAIILNNH